MKDDGLLHRLAYYRDVCDPLGYLGRLGGGRLPIFIFHDVAPDRFGRQLQGLVQKGLRGVACADVNWDDRRPGDVVLTFDDGRSSLYDVAFPLLRETGFRATAFISPGLMGDAGARGPLVTWQQVREMYASGVIDFQLHGFAHSRVFVSPRIVDFAHPGRADTDLGIAAWRVRRGGREACEVELSPGEPIYDHGSRWGARRRFLDSERVRDACRRHVEAEGGAGAFFARPDWRHELHEVAREARRRWGDEERYESDEERDADLVALLTAAHARLQEEIGVRATHFALPWAEEGEGAVPAALVCGIEHLHLGYLNAAVANAPAGGAIERHPRLKEFFVDRLRGAGRPSLPRFLLAEAQRLAAGG